MKTAASIGTVARFAAAAFALALTIASASVLRVLAVSQGDANTSNNEFKKNVLG